MRGAGLSSLGTGVVGRDGDVCFARPNNAGCDALWRVRAMYIYL